jgi:hypothetical protein
MPVGKCAVGDGFLRSCAGSSCKSSKGTWARTRRRRPAVGRGARSHKPVDRAGGVAAVYARILPASSATAGRRCRLSGAQTHCRAAPSICLAQRGNPSTGQRSRDIACACAPLSGSGGLSRKGSVKRGGVDDHGGQGRRPRGGLRPHQVLPELSREDTRRFPCAALPGLTPVGGRSRACAPLRGPRERSDERALRRAASLPTVGRGTGAPSGTVTGGTADIRGETRLVALGQRKTALRHEGVVRGQERWGLL